MKYSRLTDKHPEYDREYWAECRALYAGGETLLRDRALMARIFPKNPYEESDIYNARLQRAEYVNYAGSIVDFIVASLCAEPLSMTSQPKADEFFDEFAKATDGHEMTLVDLLREQVLTCLQTRRAWTLVDLPPRDEGAVVESEADEEELDQLRALAFPIPPESVFDWECDASGALEWALICMSGKPRDGLSGDRSTTIEKYTFYTRDKWERYEVRYTKGKAPKPNDDIPLIDKGDHSFGAVPLARLELPLGLWAMDRVHNLARSHLNKRSALTWSQFKHLFPILAAFLAPEMGEGDEIPSEAQQDPGRAENQTYGPGRIAKFGAKDDLRYVAPPSEIFKVGLEDLRDNRDETYRVLHQMALSTNNGAAALRRSGDSKKQDKAAAMVVLGHIGTIARKHAVEVYNLARKGRKDPETTFTAHGWESFDLADLADVIETAGQIDTLKIPSETFQRRRIFGTARRVLGATATPEDLAAIEKELEKNVSAEEFAGNAPPTSSDGEWGEPEGEESSDDLGEHDGDSPEADADKDAAESEQPEGAAPKAQALAMLAEDFPPEATQWASDAEWTGPVEVPIRNIDTSGRTNWRALSEPDKVEKFVGKIKSGDRKPIILVETPGATKLIIVDGHHRLLAHEKLGMPVRAYIARVKSKSGPWDEMHAAQRAGSKMK